MTAVGDDIPLSEGGELLLECISAPDIQPLWVLCSSTNTLAQVLLAIDRKHTSEDAERMFSRLRIYAISNQDDSGTWIRNNFDNFHIVSVHVWNMYGLATWTGMSGDKVFGFDQGSPDSTKMEEYWLRDNVRVGPLGSVYPNFELVSEKITPAFLYFVRNDLGISEYPDYGSLGGRYTKTDGKAGNHYSDTVDRIQGQDERTYTSNHATIWRWRDALQDDFAARIQWTIHDDLAKANHHPVIDINGDASLKPVRLDAEAGSTTILDASKTYDPDAADILTMKWWHYKEPTATQWLVDAEVSSLIVKHLDEEGRIVEVTIPPAESCAVEFSSRKPAAKGQRLHLILEVTDNGTPALTSYRRILIQATNKKAQLVR
jgi:hypothetical protein